MEVADRRARRRNPLAVTGAFRSFVLDQLADLDVIPRSMFGGVGLYHRGVFFAIVAGDVLYLKVGDTNRPDYIKAGMRPFKPYAHRPTTMQYYAVPVSVLESAEELIAWARRSIKVAAASSSRRASSPPRRRRPSAAR